MPARKTNNSTFAALTVVLVLAGVLASVLGARAVGRTDAEQSQLSFHLASAEIASTLNLAIQHEEDLVLSASAFVKGDPGTSAADFDRWAESVRAMQRYPELQNLGLVTLVPSSRLAAFEAHMAANPIRPLGPQSVGPKEDFVIFPPGNRPYYCLAVAGLARSATTFLPAGVDYCAVAPTLITARDSGKVGYAPIAQGAGTTLLGVEAPVYRGGSIPSTVAARRRTFVGWIGELLAPNVLLAQALEGHPHVAVTLRYDTHFSQVAFESGKAPASAQSTDINLRVGQEDGLGNAAEGWSVQTSVASTSSVVLANWNSRMVLLAGALLSVVLGLLIFVLGTGRRRALSLVNEKTSELSHQALHDTLTGLPNRALVLDRAEHMIARVGRRPDALAGALFIDVDGFKHVNDSLGHAAGDQLLRVVAERLQSAAREQDTVGRLGGDEFVVLVESTADEAMLDLLADRLTEVLRQPVEFDDGQKIFSVTTSIGVALGRYATPDALLRDADLALYAAKAAGKDRYALFDASINAGIERRLELQADLGDALAKGQFSLLYQPIRRLPGREIVGVEALIRWNHPTRGDLDPESFIPLAEESAMIAPIGSWVLDEACRQAAAWAETGVALGVSVNVSAHQLSGEGFTDAVRQALAISGLAPSALTLELTETALMANLAVACECLEEIRALGVHIAIDDFGTGYASLSNLQRVPVDVLKIDQSFVAALSSGGKSRELLAAILGVGQALSLAVVAEGVEEHSQLSALEGMGCEMAQGFLMGRPCPAEAVTSLLRRTPSPRIPAV